jgi:selenide,water dikinase
MRGLNNGASRAALARDVHCATDITGFGLLGHAAAVARESRLTLEITLDALPLLPHALELAPRFQPGGLKANRRQFEPRVEYRMNGGEDRRALLFDPQTSGGLFLLVEDERVDDLLRGLPMARVIGRATAPQSSPLVIV